jgi:MYND finger
MKVICHNPSCQSGEAARFLCTVCMQINYCSAACQRLDYAAHKLICRDYRTLGVFDVVNQLKGYCPLETAHDHPQPPNNSPAVDAFVSQLLANIKRLKPHKNHCLSCKCNTPIVDCNLETEAAPQLHMHDSTPGQLTVIVTLICKKCTQITASNGLLALVEPIGLERRAFCVIPYQYGYLRPHVAAPMGIINVDSRALDNIPKGFRLTSTRHDHAGTCKCRYNHVSYVVGAEIHDLIIFQAINDEWEMEW